MRKCVRQGEDAFRQIVADAKQRQVIIKGKKGQLGDIRVQVWILFAFYWRSLLLIFGCVSAENHEQAHQGRRGQQRSANPTGQVRNPHA